MTIESNIVPSKTSNNAADKDALFEAQNTCETLVELGRIYAKDLADKQFLQWLENGRIESCSYTFAEIDTRARALAVTLQQALQNENTRVENNDIGNSNADKQDSYPAALIATQPGPNFIIAFFGCLYAGVAAVPISPLKKRDSSERIQPLMSDSGAKVIVADEDSAKIIEGLSEEFTPPALFTVENIDISLADNWKFPDIDANTVAFIQYTSGSTGTPKGVVVTHNSLMSNERMLAEAMNHNSETVYISWLPVFHDMGLIGNLLQAFFLGVRCIMMSPIAFVSHPIRWLEAISKYKATTSGGPNFAYDLCVSRTTEEQRKELDLSSWQVAFNGAEPIRAETIEKFTSAFANSGFKKEAMYPCYGMAECTLFVSGSPHDQAPTTLTVNKDELNFDRISIVDPNATESTNTITLVSSGITYQDCDVRIVHPGVCTELEEDKVGEIWVSSAIVASEYKNQPDLSHETFQATIQDHKQDDGPEKQFLRTGDLGFIHQRQLYVTGRSKDLIIISGRNHYPQDIELSVIKTHPEIASCHAAAFSVDIENEERLVVVLSVNSRILKKIDAEEIIQRAKRAISKEHQISLHNLVITKSRPPLTSSGKIQRRKSKQMYMYSGFDVICELNNEGTHNG